MTRYLDSIDVAPYESFVVCNVCLRVQRGEHWVDAEVLIREIRSFDLLVLPTLESSVCPDCASPTQTAAAA
jgi:hypothetical protein